MTALLDRLRPMLSRMCNRQTLDRLIDPILTDISVEHEEAVRQGRFWRGRWVQFAGCVALLKGLAWHGISEILDWTPDDRQMLIRTIAFAAPIAGVTTLLLAVPALLNSPARAGVPYLTPFMYLIPQGLPLAIPIGFALGIVYGTAKRARPVRPNIIVFLTIVCTAIAFVDLVWILPGANQAYRVTTWGPDVVRGANELTLKELRALLWGVGNYEARNPLAPPHDWQTLALSYYMRWALSCTTLVFALFTFSTPRRRLLRGMAVSVVFLSYYQLMYGGRQLVIAGALPAFAAAWLPNVALLVLAVASIAYESRQTAQLRPL